MSNDLESLRAENERLRKERDEFERDYFEERKARYSAQSQSVALKAKLEEAAKVLEPFANYMGERGDLDSKGQPLPDAEGVGWVYLTQGDFRSAKSCLANLKGAE